MYVHELENWPKFLWDQNGLANLLTQLHHQQGRLIGSMESIGIHVQEETILQTLTRDVVKSSEIEGEILDPSLVRSSVARHLGIEVAAVNSRDKNVEGIVELMLDASQKFDQPLTKERLLRWHTFLFPVGRKDFSKIKVGSWRTGLVQVVSGQMGDEIVHFEAVSAERVEYEMELFLDWFNYDMNMDQILKAAIAHLWFVTIHPFDDGNGRIGRAIGDLMLARSEKSSRRFYSLSAQIQLERKKYYNILEKTQKGSLDITSWIEWFLGCLGRSIETALTTFGILVHKVQFWEAHEKASFNDRQRKVVNCLLDGFEGKLTSSKWAKIVKCSQDTAYRDIQDLMNQEILMKNLEGGRSTSYSLISIE